MLLETERLRLRPHTIDDFEDLHALTAAPEMRRHLAGFSSVEDSWKRLLGVLGGWATFGFSTFAVIERENGRYVGNCGVFRMVRDIDPPFAEGAPEAGWINAADRQGRGYAREAMAAVLGWFDASFDHPLTVAMIVPGNIASERIAAGLGYRPIGEALHMGDTVMRFQRRRGAAPHAGSR